MQVQILRGLLFFFEVQGAVQSVSSVTQSPAASAVAVNQSVTVTANLSGALSVGQAVYLRYTTNGYTTSTVAQMAGSGTTYTAIIPGNAATTNVSYYVFTSGTANVATNGSNADLYTINLNNNSGGNYIYTVSANPIGVVSSGGTTSATYATLKGAFDAINLGTHTGAISIVIGGNTTETAPAVLNASASGAASYTSINISPIGGGARTVSGAIAAGSPLIDLSGADNVTFNGLNTGGNSLTISNTTVSATSITSTIRFIGGATNNTITNCTILGAGTMAVATNGATIFFSTDAVTANGNDNNTISNNNIGPVGTNYPTKAILGNGSTTTTAIGNSGNVIDNNNIYDYFGAAVSSSGIATNGGCNTWSITNNRFYQTNTKTWTTGAAHRAIDIGGSSATSGAQGFTITGNTIGYASNTQTGTYTLTGSTGKFQAISFNGITLGTVSNINTNTIAAVSLTGVTSSGTSTSSPFIGILVANGLANTNSNIIGSQTVTGSLVFSTNSTTGTDVIGIYNFSLDNWTSNSNQIGGISVTNAAASGTYAVYGMRVNTGTSLTWSATSNLIGGTIANSIQLTATGAASQVIGMHTSNAGAIFTSNTIRNLTSNIGTGTTTSASVIGINVTTTTPNHTLSQNTIFNLSNTNATAATTVTGIQMNGSTANIVERNNIYGLTSATNSATAEVNGIRVAGGTTTYRNNMIAIGAGINNAIIVNGINEPLGTDNFFHNSVYIGGNPTAGTANSFAFNSTQTINTRSFRNNIFVNVRSNSGATGKHYAVQVGGTAANPTGLTINNNIYYVLGIGNVFGRFNALDIANLSSWQTVVGQDAASLYSDPQYNNPTAATPDLHIHASNPTTAEANGADVGVTEDFDGQTRSGLTPVDIGADAGNFVGLDLLAPAISYTALSNSCASGVRILTATITDASGVPNHGIVLEGTTPGVMGDGIKNIGEFADDNNFTSGDGCSAYGFIEPGYQCFGAPSVCMNSFSDLPVLYYKINGGLYIASQGNYQGGNNYAFSIGGGSAVGDIISYYIVAQDNASTPNVGVFPSTGASGLTANFPAASTPPSSPSSYTNLTTSAGTISASTASICISGTTTLTLIGSTPGATVQWESSLDNFATAPTNVGTNSTTYTSGTLTSGPIYYRAQVTCGAQSATTVVTTINVSNPNVGTPSATAVCGTGTTTLSTTGSSGTIRWYDAATGGNVLITTTPTISAATTYYIEANSPVPNATIAIGTGSTTSSSAPISPFNGGYGGMKSQYLYTAAQLQNAGLQAGDISALAFNITSVGATLPGFTVEMGNTLLNQFTAGNIQGSLTTVRNSTTFVPQNGLNNLIFNTPFNWDGTSNIIVSVSWSNNNTSNTSSTIQADVVAGGVNVSQSYRKDSETAANLLAFTGATG